MNGRNVFLLIALSLVISVVLFHQEKMSERHGIDTIRNGLKGTGQIIKQAGDVSFKGEPSKQELYMWVRYVLAPHPISYEKDARAVLVIQYLHGGDSALNKFISSNRHILYQKTDTTYRYVINESGK
ncbi:MAG: hypothetical protein EOP56_18500 [Sphingobacteriales bacterium]|nr:MAG: hypothetical protein EOP56_18500 [Sphingobacteriales bacterium]